MIKGKLLALGLFGCICFLAGCAAMPVGDKASELNKISLGMSKSEVIATMGTPSRTSATEGSEFLIYNLVDDVDYTPAAIGLGMLPPKVTKNDYFVKIQNNKVVSYGKVGDFDSTKTPEATINVNTSADQKP